MGEILVLCPLMNKSTLAYSTLYSGNTKGNWEKEKSARSELTARFALVELRGLDLLCGRGRGAALAAHRAAIHSRARSSPRWPRQKKKSARFKHTARFALVELRGLDLVCGRGRGAALAAHRAAIHSRARSSPRWPRQKKKSARFKHTARFALVELRGLEPDVYKRQGRSCRRP